MSDVGKVDKLLGARHVERRSLSGEATYLRLDDGRELVLKGVPRQSRNHWQRGKPWTELITLDLLSAEGAPVPRLVAADLAAGWLLYEYRQGIPLTARLLSHDTDTLFSPLLTGLLNLEAVFAKGQDDLMAFATPFDLDGMRQLAYSVEPLLHPDAQQAWRELSDIALQVSALSLGPTDVQPGNALWHDGRLAFIDFATIGLDFIERRLVGYGQLSAPGVGTVLTETAYNDYCTRFGTEAALRLAFFDLLFWGIVLARLYVMKADPDTTTAGTLRTTWAEPESILAPAQAMWKRFRLDDPRVVAVIDGMHLAL